ncbi:3-oxoacyl-ACP synthase [Burkholderia ubonensis]|uniref:3-oxoacyl-ACP synthase n=1 Tax=Burkholderia ubonensis TaxID=101571 RepID=A0A103RFF2_9BURK|nr:ketoacyl-ACP synthase III [Burkholderia ubonensis]AOJ63255.1 3-oxoacyl-ACP synthase [Burkholderia ubonensis]KVG66821.1 3-oxoacyl-ACP synthase [Burkholderia ubonensis]
MASRTISGVSVKAITAALPSGTIGEAEFAAIYGEREVARIVRGTGIGSIRTAAGMGTSDLIVAAAAHLMRGWKIAAGEIDGLIVVTQTPDDWSPGCAYAVHDRLGLPTDCFVVDVNAGCAGYVSGLIQAASLVASGACRNVLLCTGDINTRLVDDQDHQVRMLFGDAASATLITAGDETLHFVSGADGSGRSLLGVNLQYEKDGERTGTIRCLKMDGAAVMSFALRRVPEAIDTLLKSQDKGLDDVGLFALHQPNRFILDYIRNRLGVSPERLPVDVDGIGNTNSTSIPLLLSRRHEEDGDARRSVVMCGFGVGLAWGALLADLSKTRVLAPVEVEMDVA